MSLLALSDVSKAYAGVPALRSVSLSIAPGEIHGLIGENGAGKSTLIRILAGVERPDEAEVAIDGRQVIIDGPHAAFEYGLRFIHQELNVVPALSVAENIFLGRAYPRRFGALVDWDRLAGEARQALGRLGISHIDPRRKMARLGIGDRMLVCISAAFLEGATAARLYVMDEPTAALSGEESERLFAVLREIRRSGRSVLYVSHRLGEVMHLCDRVTVLRDGAIIGTKKIAETFENEIIGMMIGRQVGEAYPRSRSTIAGDVALAVRAVAGDRLDPFSFDLRKGEIVGIAGLSGAGQNEVLRLLVGADEARRGRIQVGGREGRPPGLAAAWRMGLAYLPRDRRSEGLVLTRAIADNITLPNLSRFSRRGVFLNKRMERAVAGERGAEVRLKARSPRQKVHELSGGNQQKVLFAKALSGRPGVLLLDEPTRGVDIGAKLDIYTLLRELSARGMAILIASSDFPELLGMCDRIIVMRGGAIATVLDAEGLTEEALLSSCYGHGASAAAAPHSAPAQGA
jgi:ABC-type sugar transport system ATPase subunit